MLQNCKFFCQILLKFPQRYSAVPIQALQHPVRDFWLLEVSSGRGTFVPWSHIKSQQMQRVDFDLYQWHLQTDQAQKGVWIQHEMLLNLPPTWVFSIWTAFPSMSVTKSSWPWCIPGSNNFDSVPLHDGFPDDDLRSAAVRPLLFHTLKCLLCLFCLEHQLFFSWKVFPEAPHYKYSQLDS